MMFIDESRHKSNQQIKRYLSLYSGAPVVVHKCSNVSICNEWRRFAIIYIIYVCMFTLTNNHLT